jgi:hypothetical protein
MKRSFFYLLFVLALDIWGFVLVLSGAMPDWLRPYETVSLCGLTGGIGGLVYCFRGLYVNTCARAGWDPKWMPWYFIRPIVSHLCGFISFIVLKTGLLVLESQSKADSRELGFYLLAFVAGLNVDKFVTKIEDLALTTWGIDKSRAAGSDKTTTT